VATPGRGIARFGGNVQPHYLSERSGTALRVIAATRIWTRHSSGFHAASTFAQRAMRGAASPHTALSIKWISRFWHATWFCVALYLGMVRSARWNSCSHGPARARNSPPQAAHALAFGYAVHAASGIMPTFNEKTWRLRIIYTQQRCARACNCRCKASDTSYIILLFIHSLLPNYALRAFLNTFSLFPVLQTIETHCICFLSCCVTPL